MTKATLTLLMSFVVSTPAAVLAETPLFEVPDRSALSDQQWEAIDASVDRGLGWLADQQRIDGSFPTHSGGQPAITSLCVMSFLARGHRPGSGPYGETIRRGIDYVLRQQRDDGLLNAMPTNVPVHYWGQGTHTGTYNHAISGLMLGEVYGMTEPEQTKRVGAAITKALALARKLQRRPSPFPMDNYGWRYVKHHGIAGKGEADLSVTGWFVMFYRSAKNAGFEVPEEHVQEAIRFVRQCWAEEKRSFVYGPYPGDRHTGRGMNGAGVLCLTIAGDRDEGVLREAGDWLLRNPIDRYNSGVGTHDRFHYGAYYASQAAFMLGGEYWRRFYPTMAQTLVRHQTRSGAWPLEALHNEQRYGQTYSTALALLSLTPPYQLLPIYQR